MKITYTFADGSTSTIEVNNEIGTFIIDCRREEENSNRRHCYHCYSLDAITYEGNEYGEWDEYPCEDNYESIAEQLRAALSKLTEIQRRRLILVARGLTVRQVAAREGVALYAVQKSLAAARKTMKHEWIISTVTDKESGFI